MIKTINCTINGVKRTIEIDSHESLLEMLRDRLGLTGTKKGCEVGECGACTVLVDHVAVDSCLYLAAFVDNKEILTVEGLAEDGEISELQKNFVEEGAVQCGFCSPGFLMSTTALLSDNPDPTEEEIRRGLSGNFCRCTGYTPIINAVQKTAIGTKSE
jgi:carbon-monoxide dehydrogenase small subunit